MNSKILFLVFLFLPCTISCAPLKKNSLTNKPPTDNFVKIFKQLEVTRCRKQPIPEMKRCETKSFYSIGSGLMITTPKNKKIILTAGHVCTSSNELPDENSLYKIKWTETIKLLDRNKNFHDGHVILQTMNKQPGPDLCSVWAPTLDDS